MIVSSHVTALGRTLGWTPGTSMVHLTSRTSIEIFVTAGSHHGRSGLMTIPVVIGGWRPITHHFVGMIIGLHPGIGWGSTLIEKTSPLRPSLRPHGCHLVLVIHRRILLHAVGHGPGGPAPLTSTHVLSWMRLLLHSHSSLGSTTHVIRTSIKVVIVHDHVIIGHHVVVHAVHPGLLLLLLLLMLLMHFHLLHQLRMFIQQSLDFLMFLLLMQLAQPPQ